MSTDPDDQEGEAQRPSKSQRKRDMHALQEIGIELSELTAEHLAQIDLQEDLRDAINEARRITDFEGKRRQMQYVGKLMRHVDPEPIRAQLEQLRSGSRRHTALQHAAEHWRQRLMTEDDAATLFAATYPGADAQQLRTLVANVKHDKAINRPPKKNRELFRIVRDVLAAAAIPKAQDPHAAD